MPNEVWFEIDGNSRQFRSIEEVRTAAVQAARSGDLAIEVYQVTRTLVRTLQRNVSVSETIVP